MRILLLYKGYPRVSQSYQYDEATEISKYHEIKIISYDWSLCISETNAPPSERIMAVQKMIKCVQDFKPDIIHGAYLESLPLFDTLTKNTNIYFTVRAHSFDVLGQNMAIYKNIINESKCKGIIVFPSFKQKLLDAGINENKIFVSYPSIDIKKFHLDIPNGNDIMSGGAMLPKKNIEGFIRLAKKIKDQYPNININFYGMVENETYYKSLLELNEKNNNPVNFVCVQHEKMPLEYKKHRWLIYSGCKKTNLIGNPLMVAEAQASGVGVLMYKIRNDLCDYVTPNGFLYENDDEVLNIVSNEFDNTKRQNAIDISKRYQINIDFLNSIWNIEVV